MVIFDELIFCAIKVRKMFCSVSCIYIFNGFSFTCCIYHLIFQYLAGIFVVTVTCSNYVVIYCIIFIRVNFFV